MSCICYVGFDRSWKPCLLRTGVFQSGVGSHVLHALEAGEGGQALPHQLILLIIFFSYEAPKNNQLYIVEHTIRYFGSLFVSLHIMYFYDVLIVIGNHVHYAQVFPTWRFEFNTCIFFPMDWPVPKKEKDI